MRSVWLVARHEYRKLVGRRAFLLSIAGIPLFILLMIGLGIITALTGADTRPVGYVDWAGLLQGAREGETGLDAEVGILPFSDAAAAQDALQAGEIQAYYVLPENYLAERRVELYYWEEAPDLDVQESFAGFVRENLAAGLPEPVQARVMAGSEVITRSADGSRQISGDNILSFLLPFAASFLFVFVVMMSAGYLLQVVSDEKENRTVEILLTSLSPEALIGGKALGLMGVALTQLAVWMIAAVVGLLVAAQYTDWAASLRVPWDTLLIITLFFFPAYALVTGLMTAIGGATSETRQGQQIAGPINLLFMLPLFFLPAILSSSDSPLVLALTLFPASSFVTVAMRWSLGSIPLWQVAASWVLLVAVAGFSVWASARIFRAGMLRYGQPLSLRSVLGALRS